MEAQSMAASFGERRGDPNMHFLVETALRYRRTFGDAVARGFLVDSQVPEEVIARVFGKGPVRH